MRNQRPGTTLVLLLVIAAALWALSRRLDDPSLRRTRAPTEESLTAHNPPAPPAPIPELLPSWKGKVRDSSGEAIPGAVVELGDQRTSSSEAGEFVLAQTPGILRIRKEGFFPLDLPPELYGPITREGGEFISSEAR